MGGGVEIAPMHECTRAATLCPPPPPRASWSAAAVVRGTGQTWEDPVEGVESGRKRGILEKGGWES